MSKIDIKRECTNKIRKTYISYCKINNVYDSADFEIQTFLELQILFLFKQSSITTMMCL